MRVNRYLGLLTVVVGLFLAATPKNQAQVSINIGQAPNCPYGYYDYAPYSCAPYGYYGPQWFSGGVFIGAGKWFHGPANFRAVVNNHLDPRHGYKGALPNPGDRRPAARADNPAPRNFKGNEAHDGQGHVVK
jgi:hypothetical protein